MKYYIFDIEHDDFLKEDGEKLAFKSNDEIVKYLKDQCQFSNDWIDKNFYSLRCQKILHTDFTNFNIEDLI